MYHGVAEYVCFAVIAAMILNFLCRRYVLVNLAGSISCSILNMVHEAYLVAFEVNVGWAPFLFLAGFLLALPVFFGTGAVFLCWREFHE